MTCGFVNMGRQQIEKCVGGVRLWSSTDRTVINKRTSHKGLVPHVGAFPLVEASVLQQGMKITHKSSHHTY